MDVVVLSPQGLICKGEKADKLKYILKCPKYGQSQKFYIQPGVGYQRALTEEDSRWMDNDVPGSSYAMWNSRVPIDPARNAEVLRKIMGQKMPQD